MLQGLSALQSSVHDIDKLLPCAVGLRNNPGDGPTRMSELIQESLVMALIVQQRAGRGANNEEVGAQGQACHTAWGSGGGHSEGALALLLPSILYWVHGHSSCMQSWQWQNRRMVVDVNGGR